MAQIYSRNGYPHTLAFLREHMDFGLTSYDLVNPPRRFWSTQQNTYALVEQGVDSARVQLAQTPAQLLLALHTDENPAAHSRRSLARLFSFFLVCEDPQRKLDARNVETLAHQVSLVQHILENDNLKKVLIADEVGLGKTIEVGLLISELAKREPGLRILYLAPARLVTNVRREFDRMGLNFRQWTALNGDARLTDTKILASLQRAVHKGNFEDVIKTGAWDVIVVDECHHLSAWNVGGTDPRLSYRLVKDLIGNQQPGGRVIFLSGTPHQGNITRFENLLLLLKDETEIPESLSGRVVYRTKEDIRDWHNNRLFPSRSVNDPTVIDLGTGYRAWVKNIHNYYKPSLDNESKIRHRAAGWRCAQALQWAVSSPQAGLGYLVRQAVRAGWKLGNPVFEQALSALRPYRLGSPNENIASLFNRIHREVGDSIDIYMEDIEFEEEQNKIYFPDRNLENLLTQGTEILQTSGDEKWQIIKNLLLDPAGKEKVVLFAQPIETVIAICQFLEKTTDRKPALIVGGQTDTERQQQVDAFWRPNGPQYLISSRAGGEGINLQIARRLIHIDVPWNPMDMEQRVGRVHRFGSTETILVDTVIVKESREADAYKIAREKLKLITSTMVEPERFEAIFSRVMSLLPPEDLQNVLIQGMQSPFSNEDQQKIANMVQQGFKNWNDFHTRYGAHQHHIQQLDPGLATWNDVRNFLETHAKAQVETLFNVAKVADTATSRAQDYSVLTLDDKKPYLCGDPGSQFVTGQDGKPLPKLGLNLNVIAKSLQQQAFPDFPTGAACLRWNHNFALPAEVSTNLFASLVYLRQTIKPDQSGWAEHSNNIYSYIIEPGKKPQLLDGVSKGQLFRGLFEAIVRIKVDDSNLLFPEIIATEKQLFAELRRPNSEEQKNGIRHAITPLFAGIITVKS